MNNDWDASYTLINKPEINYEDGQGLFSKIIFRQQKYGLINNEKLLISKQKLQLLKNKYKKLGIATGRPKKKQNMSSKKNKLKKYLIA